MIATINTIIAKLALVLTAILTLLPDSPFVAMQNAVVDSEILKALNWAFPVAEAIAHLELFVVAVAVWYGLRIVLRWIKAAGS